MTRKPILFLIVVLLLCAGTLLFSADVSEMAGALRVDPEKMTGKGIKSVRSRVCNLIEYLPDMTVLGLREDGRVLAYAFRPGDLPDLSAVENAVAIAAGGTHCAVVLRDGSVQVFGDCSHGEDKTAGWMLKTSAD